MPAWITDAARLASPAYPAETKAVALLDDITYSVAGDGTAIQHRRRVVRILRPSGRSEGEIAVPYDNATKIRSFKVWSIGPDGHEYTMKDQEMADYGYPGQGSLFEDDKVRLARAPGRDPGGVVAYEYEQSVRPFLTEETWNFQESIPKLNQSFTLELPAGFTFGAVWAHHPEAAPVDLERQRYRWEIRNTPGIDLERVVLAPAAQSLVGRMTIHYSGPGLKAPTTGTWSSIGEWYGQLANDRVLPTPEISSKAQELTAGKTDFYEKTEVLGEFVQRQIRYFVIEMGIGGYQPHPASEIFRLRYGDCKDKATLLSAMLSSVGIRSRLMMVDTERGAIDPDAPSLTGNHMISAIEIPKGYENPLLHSVVTARSGRKYLIFDPTWEMTPFGQLEHNLQGGYGILLQGAETEAIRLPVLNPDRNTIRRDASFQLKADGTLEGTVTERRFGDVSEHRRTMYTTGDAQEQRKYLERALSQDLTNFAVSGLTVSDAAALNKAITLSYSLTAEHFARNLGSLMMIRPRVLGTNGFPVDRKDRSLPIDLGETMQTTDTYEIRLPAGYTVDEIAPPVKLDVGFAMYESTTTLVGDVLRYNRAFTVRELTLPATQYATLQKLEMLIDADEQSSTVLRRK